VVAPGQTLWRIAKVYGVDLERLAAFNGIVDPTRVDVGMAIRIPGASRTLDVPPYPLPIPPPSPEGPMLSDEGTADLVWPVDGGVVLSHFGAARRAHRHAGLDIRGFRGQEIVAARAGRVRFSGVQRGYGKVVILDHGDGMQTLYAHAHDLVVREGDRVERGQTIATVGRSGNASTDHLHFEVRRDGVPIDPSPLFHSVAEVRR
jgi:LysM repeat protein